MNKTVNKIIYIFVSLCMGIYVIHIISYNHYLKKNKFKAFFLFPITYLIKRGKLIK